MPNKIDDFVPWRVLQFVMARLEQIDPANGYNTRPRVVYDLDAYVNSTAEHTVFVETSGGSPEVQGAGEAHKTHHVMRIDITTASYYQTDHPRRVAMMLEQDVRTALHSGIADVRDAIGRGASMRFISSEHDGGFLAPEKQAGFNLSVSFKWSQGSDW